jgi:transcriptional regulator with XRE-family HTH domain
MANQRRSGARDDDLSRALFALRTGASISQIAAASASGVSQAKLSRIENGRALPSVDEVRALASAYGADADEIERLAELAAQRESEFIDARVVLQAGRAHHFQQRARDAEAAATLVRSYQPAMVLGVLQTPAYISAVFSPGAELSDEDAEASIASRLTRWPLLAEPGREWRLIQTEGALRWIVRSAALMAKQLDRIAEATRLPNVRLGIIAADTIAPSPGPLHGFHIYDDESVTFGTETGTALLSNPERVAAFATTFAELERLALYDDDAQVLLARIGDDYRSRGT